MKQRRLALVAVDVRSAHNVGSLLRTADSLGVEKVRLVGITPYPAMPDDKRLPHIRDKAERRIHKTALGAEHSLDIEYVPDVSAAIKKLRSDGFDVVALEQTATATPLNEFTPSGAIALLVGNEVAGLDEAALKLCPRQVCIPMLGRKESLNVAVAAGIALYHLRFSG